MAKVKVVTNNLDYNLNREEFTDFPSQTIFSFGRFAITSNFDGRRFIDYSDRLNSFVSPITLETLELTDEQSEVILKKSNDIGLNLDKSNFNKFVRFGSAYEYLRVSVEEIITKYPGSIYVDNQISGGGGITFFDFNYNVEQDVSTFSVPISVLVNNFGIIYLDGSDVIPDENIMRNLNISFNDYVVWSNNPDATGVIAPIIGFSGYTSTAQYITLRTRGNPFDGVFQTIPSTGASISFHIKPNSSKFEEFRQNLTDYQKYMISTRNDDGFIFEIKEPILLDNGNIEYNTVRLVWPSSDDYNINFSGINYRNFLDRLIGIGGKYDAIKTDLIARFLTPTSLKTYDLTEEGKITKLLRVYGWEFDQLRVFIDSLAYVNRISYDKKNNAPDQIISNLSKLFGWEHFSLVNEEELVENLLTIDETERDLNSEFLPVEIDIELWRRILLNTNYFWKTKGTREAIKSIFLMIGIPEPFINITEYVYTVDEKINPNQVNLEPMDFGSNAYPFDDEGYPIAPPETNDFYFQLSGNTDSGQAYMDNFRRAGFLLERTIDNKKSWTEEGEVIRRHPSTIQYFQKDSKLVINTKEVDIGLDVARGIEEDVFNYLQIDYSANSSGFTLPISYVNLSLARAGNQDTFVLPPQYNTAEGDIEVRWNGILLNAPSSGNTEELSEADYFVSGNTITVPALSNINENDGRNVLQVTYLYSGSTNPISGMTVNYVVTRVKPNITGTKITLPSVPNTKITLPSVPNGDVQLTINGIALTRRTSQFNGDYFLDIVNTGQTDIVITNQAVIGYFLDAGNSPHIQVTYMEVFGSTSVQARSEIHRVDSFSGSKFYFNSYANRFTYVLNYRVNNVENVKILVDGIALEPAKDYVINPSNSFELYLPRNIKFGSVITAYYLVGGDEIFDMIIDESFGLGDISEMSFLEFTELAQRKLINARTRKIVTDFKGGWYPTLLMVYNEYLKRANLPDNNPLQSNGYTFQNLFGFLSKYNSFFEKFIKQLVSSTIILRKSGLLVRNSMFTRQKFTYKRGVAFNYKANVDDNAFQRFGFESIQDSIQVDNNDGHQPITFNTDLNYLGDSGSIFLIPQQATTIVPSLNTITGVSGRTFNAYTSMFSYSINGTGGNNIVMFDSAEKFGVEYRKVGEGTWIDRPSPPYNKSDWDGNIVPSTPIVTSNSFSPINLIGLEPDTLYEYRAFIEINGERIYGQTIQTRTSEVPIPDPSVQTIQGMRERISIPYTNNFDYLISGTGGEDVVRTEDVEFYGMLYKLSSQTWGQALCIERNAGVQPIQNNEFSIDISGLNPSTGYDYRAYVTVEGIKYCGLPFSETTCDLPLGLPEVLTGCATDVTQVSMSITGNTIIDDGNSTITEHGVVWTHSTGNNSDSTLRCGASGVNYCSSTSSIGVDVPYDVTLSNLPVDTQTWYRAFARNSSGLDYGEIKNQRTCESFVSNRTLNFSILPPVNGSIDGSYCVINTSNQEILASIAIPNLVTTYENQIILPDVDYCIDTNNIRLYDMGSNQFVGIQLRRWSWDNEESFGPISPEFTDQNLLVFLEISDVPL